MRIFARLFAALALFHSFSHTLSLDLKRGLEKHEPFVILHLRDDTPFECRTYYGETGEASLYRCLFARMPEMALEPVKSDFFEIDFKREEGRFVVDIVPLKKSLLHPLPPPVHEVPVLPAKMPPSSKHWVVVGYLSSPPYLGQKKRYDDALSFPLELSRYAIPTVGAVDINGEPVFMKSNRDIEKFMAVKEAFNAGKYRKAYELANDALELYPDSIFASDFLRYKIKALFAKDMKENADEIIKLGKFFIKRYASDEYLPEVLLLLARVYSATGFVSDANYFFNRLIQEHAGTKYANLGLIYLGDQFYINGDAKEATKRYLEAYYNAKDLDVASLAAYKLGIRYLDRGKVAKGVEYLEKIWKKNPEFLLKDKEDAHKIAQQLASHKRYDLAIAIDKALLKRLKKLDDMYEEVLFEIGEWYDEKGDTKEAVAWYERYLDEFAYGLFSDRAKKNLDALFVAGNDANATEALQKYESLMREYRGTAIADKALAAKAKLLAERGRYDEALALKPLVEKIADEGAKRIALEALRKAATEAFDEAVKKKACKRAVAMVETYGVKPSGSYDTFLYDCYVTYARYDKALALAKKHLVDRKLADRAAWTCRALHALVGLGRYGEALEAAKEYQSLGGGRCATFDWDLAKALHGAGGFAEEMAQIRKMAERYGPDMRLADIYKMGIERAKAEGDDLQRLWLLKRLIALQNEKGSHPYSPWAEFEAIKLLKSMKKYGEALKVAEGMKALGLKGEKAARWRYELATLYQRLGKTKEAKESFEACAATEEGGAWRKLCQEALALENL
ncbi:tetratricopeptide repeat protein [Hydrogenimonas sp.]